MAASAKLKFDQITVWDNGKGGADGKGSIAGFVRSRPTQHEITQNAGVELPDFLGKQAGGKGTGAKPKQSAAKSGAKPEVGVDDAGE